MEHFEGAWRANAAMFLQVQQKKKEQRG